MVHRLNRFNLHSSPHCCADIPAEAEPGDAAVSVAVVPAAAPAPVQPGAGAPEDAAGGAADGAPEAAAASAGSPSQCHAGHGARQTARPEGAQIHLHSSL